ncbi:MAG: transglutaminase family protein [Candidatus Nanopelagicales bacterium]
MAGRRLRITHRSGYRYVTDVHASFNEVRMTPAEVGGQVLLSHELQIDPRGVVYAYQDYWGAMVEAFDIHEPHRVLEIVAISTVETPGGHPAAPGLSWEDLAVPAVADRFCEFLAPSPFVDDAGADPSRIPLLEEFRALPTPAEAIEAVVAAVYGRIRYTPGVTSVSTTAREAWESAEGVCQDFSHASLSLLRALGIPARYVSGYLHTEEEAVGESVTGESHAWIEAWNGGWEAFDPTNDRRVASAHVKVASGRDYRDVPPLKGLYAGGGSEDLGVVVEITQLPTDEDRSYRW